MSHSLTSVFNPWEIRDAHEIVTTPEARVRQYPNSATYLQDFGWFHHAYELLNTHIIPRGLSKTHDGVMYAEGMYRGLLKNCPDAEVGKRERIWQETLAFYPKMFDVLKQDQKDRFIPHFLEQVLYYGAVGHSNHVETMVDMTLERINHFSNEPDEGALFLPDGYVRKTPRIQVGYVLAYYTTHLPEVWDKVVQKTGVAKEWKRPADKTGPFPFPKLHVDW